MEKPEQVGQIDPESAIQAACIESAIHERVMPLHHHESFAFQAVHRPTSAPSTRLRRRLGASQTDTNVVMCLAETVEDKGEAAGQQPTPEDRGTEGKDRAGTSRRIGPRHQIAYPALNHQDCQRRQAAHAKPPQKRSHEPPWSDR
ncbi:MAG: hypothetical protein LZF60_160094 [Nitrospira sp.]|nr:MAG: hypothetical protein LZF60_160094 [Nitrospira sp.]